MVIPLFMNAFVSNQFGSQTKAFNKSLLLAANSTPGDKHTNGYLPHRNTNAAIVPKI